MAVNEIKKECEKHAISTAFKFNNKGKWETSHYHSSHLTPHTSQTNGFSPVCILLCSSMLPRWEKHLPQNSQEKGRLPACRRRWLSRLAFWVNLEWETTRYFVFMDQILTYCFLILLPHEAAFHNIKLVPFLCHSLIFCFSISVLLKSVSFLLQIYLATSLIPHFPLQKCSQLPTLP